MLVDILQVKKPLTTYPDVKHKQFESLSTYLEIARKIVCDYAVKYSSLFIKDILNNDDTMSYIAHSIMLADWMWDADHQDGQCGAKTKKSYRYTSAIWAIKGYIARKYRNKHKHTLSLFTPIRTNNYDELYLHNLATDNEETNNPHNIVSQQDLVNHIYNTLDRMVGDNCISVKDAQIFRLRYKYRYTLANIGKYYKMTRENVRQRINYVLEKLQRVISDD